jgi:WD domain, G-beta repeat
MLCCATLNPLVVQLAVSVAASTGCALQLAIALGPSLNSTVPPGLPAPGAVTAILALNVTGWPYTDKLSDEVSAALVLATTRPFVFGACKAARYCACCRAMPPGCCRWHLVAIARPSTAHKDMSCVCETYRSAPGGASCAATATVMDRWNNEYIHILAPGENISCLAFSPDGAQLATSSANGKIRLWERVSWIARRIGKHATWVSTVTLSPDGALLASCSTVGEIALWDGRTGAHVGDLHDDGLYVGMNITGASGITENQRAGLVALGAINGAVTPKHS